MKLVQITQLSNDENLIHDCDLLICGCGYEDRCTSYTERNIDELQRITYKVVLIYSHPQIPKLQEHITVFSNLGFKEYTISEVEDVTLVLQKTFSEIANKKSLKIVVDYSSMDRQWYSRILLFFNKYNDQSVLNVRCCFTYSIPKLTDETFDKRFSINGLEALSGFSSISIPDRPTALIVGLGNDGRALSALRYFADIDYVHYFYTDSMYVPTLGEKYKKLLFRSSLEFVHEYNLNNMVSVFNMLCDIYKSLKDNYRLVIISCGPKPFTLMSLVFAQIYGIDVWYMKSNLGSHYVERQSVGENINYEIEYKISHNETTESNS